MIANNVVKKYNGRAMNTKYIHIVLAIWILAAGSIGFSESFPNRPTAYDLEGIVILGKECVLGVNERCYATQVSPPFVKTNAVGWYLDQSTMGTIASTIKSLVSCYVDPDTIYNGITNIVMLSVTGLWAQLEIGNYTNQFTKTPVSGTNPPTYGDDPWRIYEMNLEERHKVLNALQITYRQEQVVTTNLAYKYPNNRYFAHDDINGYYAIKADFLATNWIDGANPLGYAIGANLDNLVEWTMGRGRGKLIVNLYTYTNVSIDSSQIYLVTRQDAPSWYTTMYIDDDEMGSEPNTILLKDYSAPPVPSSYISEYIGNRETAITLGSGFPDVFTRTWYAWYTIVMSKWNFQYCTDE